MNILLSLLIGVCFLSLMIGKAGVPESISSTAYIVERKVVYTIVLAVTGGLLLPTLIEKARVGTEWLAFLSIAGLLAVAFTPDYKTRDEVQHNIGGFLCGILSQVYVALNDARLLLAWTPFLIYWVLFRDRNYTFWAEVTCMASVYAYCLT